MSYESVSIRIEQLENGFTVECPDLPALAKARAQKEKSKGVKDAPYISTYPGDFTKKFSAKSVKEVIALVKSALEKMPENEYDVAFGEAAEKANKE